MRFAYYGIVTAVMAAAQSTAPPPPPPPVPVALRDYNAVTAERLTQPDDGDWTMIRRTYDGWGYSPLTQITPDNVQRLQPAWVFATGVNSGHEAAPLVNNGVMFVATPGSQVLAIDASTGNLLWRYRRQLPAGAILPTKPAAAWRSTETKCSSRRATPRW